MRAKKNNNLVAVHIGDRTRYYTSTNRAGCSVGLAAQSVIYAIEHNSRLRTNADEEVTFEIVDGSEIKYKDIN